MKKLLVVVAWLLAWHLSTSIFRAVRLRLLSSRSRPQRRTNYRRAIEDQKRSGIAGEYKGLIAFLWKDQEGAGRSSCCHSLDVVVL